MSVLSHRLGPLGMALALLGVVAGLWIGTARADATGIAGLGVDIPGVQPQGRNVVLTVHAGAGEIVTIGVSGHVRQGGRNLPLERGTATAGPGSRATIALRPRKDWQERKIKQALAKGRTLTATITVRVKDVFGNIATRSRSITLT